MIRFFLGLVFRSQNEEPGLAAPCSSIPSFPQGLWDYMGWGQ